MTEPTAILPSDFQHPDDCKHLDLIVQRNYGRRWVTCQDCLVDFVRSDWVIDADHLAHQREWSEETFGPGTRLLGVLDHIRKELAEIEADPTDLSEWVDVIILAFDGAWRAGWEPQQIIDAIKAKQAKNEARTWPDWRTMSADRAIEHDRSADGENGSGTKDGTA